MSDRGRNAKPNCARSIILRLGLSLDSLKELDFGIQFSKKASIVTVPKVANNLNNKAGSYKRPDDFWVNNRLFLTPTPLCARIISRYSV